MFIKDREETLYIVVIPTKDTKDLTALDISKRDRGRGSLGIGCHYVIRKDGMVETGRELDKRGNRRRKYNSTAVYIDLVGQDGLLKNEQMLSLADLKGELMELYPDAELIYLV